MYTGKESLNETYQQIIRRHLATASLKTVMLKVNFGNMNLIFTATENPFYIKSMEKLRWGITSSKVLGILAA